MGADNEISEFLSDAMQEPGEETVEKPETDLPNKGGEAEPDDEREKGAEESDEAVPKDDGSGDESDDDGGDEGDDGELSEVEQLKKQLSVLKEQLNQTSHSEEPPAPKAEFEPISDDVFKDIDFDALLDDPDSLKSAMVKLANTVKEQTEKAIFNRLPDQVSSIATQQMDFRKTADDFYSTHQALAEVKPYVANITKQVSNEHPDWTFQKVLSEVADRAYKAMGLPKPSQEDTRRKKAGKKKPAFASGTKTSSTRNKAGSDLSELESEISELLED